MSVSKGCDGRRLHNGIRLATIPNARLPTSCGKLGPVGELFGCIPHRSRGMLLLHCRRVFEKPSIAPIECKELAACAAILDAFERFRRPDGNAGMQRPTLLLRFGSVRATVLPQLNIGVPDRRVGK